MKLRSALIGLIALGGAVATTGAASAMPNGLSAVPAAKAASGVDEVHYVCNWRGRCWWRPNYYRSYGYYGGPRFYGPRFHGWHHRHWRHRHWHRW